MSRPRPHVRKARAARAKASALGALPESEPASCRADGSPVARPGDVYVTRTGTRFHAGWCRILGDLWDLRSSGVFVTTPSAAQARGLLLCRTCEVEGPLTP